MLWTIFVILLILWALGMVSGSTMGGFIHLLLILARCHERVTIGSCVPGSEGRSRPLALIDVRSSCGNLALPVPCSVGQELHNNDVSRAVSADQARHAIRGRPAARRGDGQRGVHRLGRGEALRLLFQFVPSSLSNRPTPSAVRAPVSRRPRPWVCGRRRPLRTPLLPRHPQRHLCHVLETHDRRGREPRYGA